MSTVNQPGRLGWHLIECEVAEALEMRDISGMSVMDQELVREWFLKSTSYDAEAYFSIFVDRSGVCDEVTGVDEVSGEPCVCYIVESWDGALFEDGWSDALMYSDQTEELYHTIPVEDDLDSVCQARVESCPY